MSTKILEVLELSMMVSSDELMLTKMLEDNLIAPVLLSSPWTILLHLLFEVLLILLQNVGRVFIGLRQDFDHNSHSISMQCYMIFCTQNYFLIIVILNNTTKI